MVVLDVGANLGLYTCLAAKRVGPTGQVHAFEPVAGIFQRLRRNLELNRLPGVVSNRCCLAASAGVRTITVCGGDRGAWSSLAAPGLDVRLSTEEVEATTLDGYVAAKGLTKVDLLKLDVEGAELEVLQGGAGLLSRDPRPLVLCEIEDVRAQAFGLLGRDTAAFLADRRYQWHEFGGRPGAPELSPIPVLEAYPSGNYLGVPEERASLVTRWLGG
jgi:FkbM family methyltransferase